MADRRGGSEVPGEIQQLDGENELFGDDYHRSVSPRLLSRVLGFSQWIRMLAGLGYTNEEAEIVKEKFHFFVLVHARDLYATRILGMHQPLLTRFRLSTVNGGACRIFADRA
jgi:hypothetical protein